MRAATDGFVLEEVARHRTSLEFSFSDVFGVTRCEDITALLLSLYLRLEQECF